MSPNDRVRRAKEKKCCLNCLRRDHVIESCPSKRSCFDEGCSGRPKHHTLLHGADIFANQLPITPNTSHLDSVRRYAPHTIYTSAKRVLCWTTYLSILKVRAKFGERTLDTYALLDNGAAGSLNREDFATEMGMSGKNELINFGTVHRSDPLLPSRTVEFELLAPHDDSIRFEVTANTTPVLQVTSRRWKAPSTLTDWAYLDGVSYPDVDHGEVTILIGYAVFEAHIQKEIRRPPVGVQGPFAVLFPLGWSLCGPVFEMSKRSRSIFCIIRDELLPQHVEKFMKRESSGTRPAQPPKLTPEEERVVWMVQESTELVNGRFEAGLPWVRDDLILPNNRQTAYKLFNHLDKSFAKRDPSYVAKFSAQMDEYEELGFSRRLRPEELHIAHPRQ